jgi:hypothetical protein
MKEKPFFGDLHKAKLVFGGLFGLIFLLFWGGGWVVGGIIHALVDNGIIHWPTPPAAPPKKTAQRLPDELRLDRILAAGASLRKSASDPSSIVFEDVRAQRRRHCHLLHLPRA